MKKIITLFLLTFLCSAIFAGGKKAPKWVENPYLGYSEDKFIAASAMGLNYEESDKKALTAIASVIMQNIDFEEFIEQKADSNGKELSTYLSQIRTNSKIKDISALEIKSRYKGKDKIYYSHAVLDKEAACRNYSLIINKNSMEIETLIESSNSPEFSSCRNLAKAYRLASENTYYVSILSVLKPNSKKIFTYGTSSDVEKKLREILSEITVCVEVTGINDGRIANAANDVINSYGIKTIPILGKNKSAYIFSADAVISDTGKQSESEIFFKHYTLAAALKETNTKKNIMSFSSNGRVGKLSEKEAEQSAVRAVEKAIKENFAQKFKSLLE